MKRRLIAIAGPPCSGKSTAGAILAELLSLAFLETDRMVEESSGRSICWIFDNQGEAAFRELERKAVVNALSGNRRVVALGGGTLLDPSTLRLVESECRIFTLWASGKVLAERNSGGRPLAGSEDQLMGLLESRRKHYLSLPGRIDTEGRTPEEIAAVMSGILRKEDPSLWSR